VTEDTDWRSLLGEAMLGVFELTQKLPAEPWRIPLVRSLAVVSNGLASPSADPTVMLGAMTEAVREALALEASQLLDAGMVEKLEPAFNALLAHRKGSSLDGLRRAALPAEPVLTRSRGSPRLLVIIVDPPRIVVEASPEESVTEVADARSPGADDEALPRPEPRRLKEGPERYDPDAPAPALVRLADSGAEPRPLGRFYDGVADRSFRLVAMLARHRSERRMTEWAAEERRILAAADAVAATGPLCVQRAIDWWIASLESPDPWKTWAPCFCLGVIDGSTSLRTIRDGLRELPPAAARHAELAGEALAVSPHPDMGTLVKDLRVDAHPIARSVGVGAGSRLGLLSPEDTAAHLADPSPVVTLAAIRAGIYCEPPSRALQAQMILWMHYDDRAVAFAAARALMLLGRTEPLIEIRRHRELVSKLGPLGVIELLVLGGEAQDLGLVQAILTRTKVSAALLRAVARLGHPGTWAFLLHYLAEKDFKDAALDALHTLFGERVPRSARLDTPAWRDAVAAGRFDPARRIRRGEPWSPAVVAAECTSTHAPLSRYDVEQRLDELSVRTGALARVDLSRWSPMAMPALADYLATMNQVSRNWVPGSWSKR
jgi:hypothetical protein